LISGAASNLPSDAAAAAEGITIELRGGTYELAEPLILSAEDAGATAPLRLVVLPNMRLSSL